VKILLDEMGIDYEPTGSTTFKSTNGSGRGTDESFYIENCEAVRVGKGLI